MVVWCMTIMEGQHECVLCRRGWNEWTTTTTHTTTTLYKDNHLMPPSAASPPATSSTRLVWEWHSKRRCLCVCESVRERRSVGLMMMARLGDGRGPSTLWEPTPPPSPISTHHTHPTHPTRRPPHSPQPHASSHPYHIARASMVLTLYSFWCQCLFNNKTIVLLQISVGQLTLEIVAPIYFDL